MDQFCDFKIRSSNWLPRHKFNVGVMFDSIHKIILIESFSILKMPIKISLKSIRVFQDIHYNAFDIWFNEKDLIKTNSTYLKIGMSLYEEWLIKVNWHLIGRNVNSKWFRVFYVIFLLHFAYQKIWKENSLVVWNYFRLYRQIKATIINRNYLKVTFISE